MRRAVLAAVLSVSALTAAAVDIRSLDRAFDYEAIVHLGVPDSATVEERARYAVALARVGRASESAKFADQLVKEHPDDRWSWYAVAAGGARGDVRLAASEKMLSLPGERADEMILARENMLARSSHFAELHEWLRTLPESPAKALAQAEGLVIEANIEEKKALNREALKILKAARRRWPSDLRLALAEAESLLDVDHRAEARALVGSAAKRTPALKVHRLLWTAAFVPGVSDAAARGVVHRDLEQLLARRGDWPEVEVASAIEYIYLHEPAKADALFERAQREQRASYAGEQALWWRYFGPQMDERNGPWSKAAATRDEERLRAYLAYSYHSSVFNTAKGAVELFRLISRDEHPDREELKSVIETMQPMVRTQPEIDSEGARAMAEFGLDLEEAEKLARHALEAVSAQKSSPATLAVAHDALGWVLFKRGDLTGAEKELAAAREADPFNFDVNVHLGRVAEEQKRFDEAARDYFAASRTPTRWENRAGDDLRRVFAASHDGSMAGFDSYVARLDREHDAAEKKAMVVNRDRKGVRLPSFQLTTTLGKRVTSRELAGKVAVINFWALWCGACMSEMRDVAKLGAKFKDDPGVVVLTVNIDHDPVRVRQWIAKNNFRLPVLLDDGWAGRQQIAGYPTTWFVDPDGRIAFTQLGATTNLVNEFRWRVDALKR